MSNERVALAQELHDGIAQDLVVLGFSIDQAIAECADPTMKTLLRQIRFSTTDLIEKVRKEMYQLRNSEPLESPSAKSDTYFEIVRIVQEIVRNIQKHSNAGEVSISISDDGQGGVHSKIGSYGVPGLHERIKSINGAILIESDSNGTRINLKIPLEG